MKLGCVVMAAGNSSRFGENKLTQILKGKTLIQRTLDAIPADRFHRVVVVTQYPEIFSAAEGMGFSAVKNLHPDWGVSHTISLGLGKLMDCDGVLFTVSDQPMLSSATFIRVIRAFEMEPDRIVAAACRGVRGNPCLFPRRFFPELMKLTGDVGGGAVIRRSPDALRLVETPDAELEDCDTKEDLEQLMAPKPSV